MPELTNYHHLISGAVAGICSRLVISPFDVLKIRFQLQSQRSSISTILQAPTVGGPIKYESILGSIRLIIREEGVLALWKGNLSAMWLYFTFGGIQFYSFNILNKQYNSLVAGGMAGVLATVATYPFDLLRTRFAAQGNIKVYNGLLSAIKDIRNTEGLIGFYRGLGPSIISIIPQMGLTFHFHDYYNRKYNNIVEFTQFNSKFQSIVVGMQHLVTGGLAGITSKLLVMPMDVIRKRLQVQGPARNALVVSNIPSYTGPINVFFKIIKYEGILALYKGLVPTLLKSAPSSAVTFFVVDWCNRYFKQA